MKMSLKSIITRPTIGGAAAFSTKICTDACLAIVDVLAVDLLWISPGLSIQDVESNLLVLPFDAITRA